MAQLTFITVCMGRLSFLQKTLPRMAAQPDCDCVVVDYSCPESSGAWVEAAFPAVRVLRQPGHQTLNITAARNAGARLADTPWLCFIDADVLLDAGFAEHVLPALTAGHYYRAHPASRGLCGTAICSKEDFVRAGEYDEVFQSYGDDDFDLYDAFTFAGLQAKHFSAALATHLEHGDELRVRFFPVKEHRRGNITNRLYRLMKWETARFLKRTLTHDERRALYARVAERAKGLTTEAGTGRFFVDDLLNVLCHEIRTLLHSEPTSTVLQRLRQALVHPLGG